MKVKNKGVFEFQSEDYHNLIPIDFNILGRELWLDKIQYIDTNFVGCSDFSYDATERWYIIFHVNCGIGEGKCFKGGEDYMMVLEIEVDTWCRPDDMVAKEVCEGLKHYPIIKLEELFEAFKQRRFFKNLDKYCIVSSNDSNEMLNTSAEPFNHWKPTDEDMRCLLFAIESYKDKEGFDSIHKGLQELYHKLQIIHNYGKETTK